MSVNQRHGASWPRLLHEWKPGLVSALGLCAIGAVALVLLQDRIPNPYLVEGSLVTFFLCYSAIFIGYAVARGHDDKQGRDTAYALAVRAAIPYTGKSLALISLGTAFGFFLFLAAARTPQNLKFLREARLSLISKFDSDQSGGTRLNYIGFTSHSTPRSFWRRVILGIQTLRVLQEGRELDLLVPSELAESTIERMKTGYILAQPLASGEFAVVEVHDHLYALEARGAVFVFRAFAFSLAESFRWMAALVYVAGMACLVVHRKERSLRERLFASLPQLDLDRFPRATLKPAGLLNRLKRFNPLLCHAFVAGEAQPHLVSYRIQIENPEPDEGVLLDTRSFGGGSGHVIIPISMVKRIGEAKSKRIA